MVAPTPPTFQSQLSQPFQANNFIAVQSAKLDVTNTTTAGGGLTFTDLPGTGRVTAKITNTGTKGCFMASGHGSATAVVATTTPTPASGDGAVATCDYIAAGAILTQDYVAGTNTFASITDGSDTTTLQISIGYGQ